MFERFTDKARFVVMQAQEAAKERGHDHIDTEHLLLGLTVRDNSVATTVLLGRGISLESLRSATEQLVPAGAAPVEGNTPFVARAKKTLEMSLREALGLKHNYIGTEHLLLGLLTQDDGVAAQVLRDHGVELEQTRADVVRVLQEHQQAPPTD